MTIRKIVHNIDFIHVLTFNQHYRSIVAPYFDYENLEYGIDNENTINESIKLIFKKEGFGIQLKKEGAILVYEGDVKEVKKSNPIVDIYFDLFEKIRKIEGFTKVIRHKMALHFVDTFEKEEVEKFLTRNSYLKNPFGQLKQFSTVLEFDIGENRTKIQFGNFDKLDIEKHNLSQFNTEYNENLIDKFGKMAIVNVQEQTDKPSFSKFKQLIVEGESVLNKYIGNEI